MGLTDDKKRKHNGDETTRKKIKVRNQQHYSSGSDSEASEANDEFEPVDLAESGVEGSEQDVNVEDVEDVDDIDERSHRTAIISTKTAQRPTTSSISSSDADSDSESFPHSNPNRTKVSKRNDPTSFANSISAILTSKLTAGKRSDPVLARSSTAAQANAEIASAKLETQAKHKIRDEKKAALEKGRVKDVLLGTDALSQSSVNGKAEAVGDSVKEVQELEKRLKKTAQRGVVKLFNAVRQAQVRAEEAAKEKGSRGRREEKVAEMSKKGFLELVAGGGREGKRMAATGVEEA